MKSNALLLLVLPALACSAADPGALTFGPRHDAGVQQVSSSTDGGSGSDAGGSLDGGPDGSAHPADGGRDAADAAAPLNAFTGAAAFASAPVATSAEQEHATRNVGIVPTGQSCLDCHNGAGATKFGFAGTIYKDALGAAAAPDVELRIVNAQGVEKGSVHSDANGNFWLVDNAVVTAGSLTGARNATTTTLMTDPIANGGCNSANCHDSKRRLHLP